jgi:hypothetical protein
VACDVLTDTGPAVTGLPDVGMVMTIVDIRTAVVWVRGLRMCVLAPIGETHPMDFGRVVKRIVRGSVLARSGADELPPTRFRARRGTRLAKLPAPRKAIGGGLDDSGRFRSFSSGGVDERGRFPDGPALW